MSVMIVVAEVDFDPLVDLLYVVGVIFQTFFLQGSIEAFEMGVVVRFAHADMSMIGATVFGEIGRELWPMI